jgi:hypothetical protein
MGPELQRRAKGGNVTRKRSLLCAIALVVATAVVGTAASAGASPGDAGNQLAGAWNVTVRRPAPLPPLASLQVFTSDGSVIEMSDEPPATRSPQFGTWERVEGRLYAASAVVFRFDPTGAHVATIKINRNIRLSEDGQTFRQTARATTYDLNGNVISSFPVVGDGERMQVERIPDQP